MINAKMHLEWPKNLIRCTNSKPQKILDVIIKNGRIGHTRKWKMRNRVWGWHQVAKVTFMSLEGNKHQWSIYIVKIQNTNPDNNIRLKLVKKLILTNNQKKNILAPISWVKILIMFNRARQIRMLNLLLEQNSVLAYKILTQCNSNKETTK